MLSEINLLPPFKFNPLKHHRAMIVDFIENASDETMKAWAKLVQSNYIDIYTGSLDLTTLCAEIKKLLDQQNINSKSQFLKWVQHEKPYKTLVLSDKSEWILRKGDDKERYIHFHPSRTGAFTIRFKGTTLVTAYKLYQKHKINTFIPTLKQVNASRIEMGLSPVKRLYHDKGILKCWLKLVQ